jgi:hypothetical protein
MATIQYVALTNRCSQLETTFLGFPNLDSAQINNQDRIKAFILLTHAELEYYFECISEKIHSLHVTRITTPVLDYSRTHEELFVFGLGKMEPTKDFTKAERAERLLKNYQQQIVNNNGIKSKDILQLLLPAGIDIGNIPEVLKNSLNAYGEKRGDFAHKGGGFRSKFVIDRDSQTNELNQILSELNLFDNRIQARYMLP